MNSTTHTLSPLRQRFLDDMRMRKLAAKTQSGYLRTVSRFYDWLKRSPDTATAEDLRRYQMYLVDHGMSSISLKGTSINPPNFLKRRKFTTPKIGTDIRRHPPHAKQPV